MKPSRKCSGLVTLAIRFGVFLRLMFLVEMTFGWLPTTPARRTTCPFNMMASSSSAKEATRIMTCSSTKELATAVSRFVQPHHVVAELGSQLREVSTRICEACDKAVLVDVTRRFPKARHDPKRTESMRLENTTSFFPEVATFCEISQLLNWPQAFFNDSQRYDVLVLDVNAIVGNDLEWTSFSLIQQFELLNQNANLVVLVKSESLNQWASRLVNGHHWRGAEHHTAIPPPHFVATVGVQEYRKTIPYTVRPDDAVLEVGCHFGTSTALIQNQAQYCIGVDVGSKIIREAHERHPGIYFRVGDAWKTGELLRIQQDYYQQEPQTTAATARKIGFDVVYVDVGGLSGCDGLLEAIALVNSIRHALEPRCIVIKSLCMQRLSSRLVPFWQSQKRRNQLGGASETKLLVGQDCKEEGRAVKASKVEEET